MAHPFIRKLLKQLSNSPTHSPIALPEVTPRLSPISTSLQRFVWRVGCEVARRVGGLGRDENLDCCVVCRVDAE